ncbi:hypothetical protein, partial [Rouxiella badensis]|uniref:hypothetical protein n=1 Tax=Rouxiella badensis TaxID=1646377 RepID=UPI003C310D21
PPPLTLLETINNPRDLNKAITQHKRSHLMKIMTALTSILMLAGLKDLKILFLTELRHDQHAP